MRDTDVIARRIAVCLIDCALVVVPSLVAFAPLLFVLVFCVFYLVYIVMLDGCRGRTLGKALCGIAVIREEDGGVPGPGRAALRAVMFLFVDMLVGVFVMLASPKRQRPKDVAASTFVVRKKHRAKGWRAVG